MQSIVLRKKMKPLMALLALLIGCPHLCNGQRQNSFEVDIASAIIYGRISIGAEHAFSGRWSVRADASVSLGGKHSLADTEERAHWNELYGDGFSMFSPDSRRFIDHSISFRFWPRSAFEGPVISFGGRFDAEGIPGLTIGLGYNCPIWRNIHAAAMYCAAITDCISNTFKPAEGLKIGLSYVF